MSCPAPMFSWPTTSRRSSENAVVSTPYTVSRIADRPSVAAGFCRIDVNALLRISPTPSGRSGIPPGSGPGGWWPWPYPGYCRYGGCWPYPGCWPYGGCWPYPGCWPYGGCWPYPGCWPYGGCWPYPGGGLYPGGCWPCADCWP